MKIHLIGLGERIMSDLAATLSQQGHKITGSDVSLPKPALHSLANTTVMPERLGWFPQKIQPSLDKVIVGRKVHQDNPELQAAQQLGLPVCSHPEYIYSYAQNKQRIVIAGGEEKNLLCLLVLHVLEHLRQPFDYVIDSPHLDTSVRLSDAPIIILEGDLDPASPTDTQPQSLCYQHNIALISGIGWESSDTYATQESYLKQLTKLADVSPKGGTLIYYEEDRLIKVIGSQARTDVKAVPYQAHAHRHEGGATYMVTPQKEILLQHAASTRAVAGAQQLLHNLAIQDQQFYEALATFLAI